MSELAIGHVEYDSVINLCPVSVERQEDKRRVPVDEVFDQPRTSNSVHFNFLASDPFHELDSCFVAGWFWYAVIAAILYGAHQIFTRLAAERIGEGLGGFVVEASAALSILIYLVFLWLAGRWSQKFSMPGFNYSLLTGICVGAGTSRVLLTFSKGRPALFRSSHFSGRRGNHGHRRDSFLSRTAIVAANSRHCVRHRRFVFAAKIKIQSSSPARMTTWRRLLGST
jgi:hypothetical protein